MKSSISSQGIAFLLSKRVCERDQWFSYSQILYCYCLISSNHLIVYSSLKHSSLSLSVNSLQQCFAWMAKVCWNFIFEGVLGLWVDFLFIFILTLY